MLERMLAHSLPDPAQTTLWYCEVPFTNGMVYHVMAERVAATFPKTAFRPRLTDGRNHYYPEMTDTDGINVAFYETFDFRVTTWLESWRKLIEDGKGNYGVANIYKRDILVRLYSRDNMSKPIRVLRYKNCAPTDQTPFELSYDDELGRVTVEAQFSCDGMEIEKE